MPSVQTSDLIDLLGKSGVTFHSMPLNLCPRSGLLTHVPVICLDKDMFGVVFEYVSTLVLASESVSLTYHSAFSTRKLAAT